MMLEVDVLQVMGEVDFYEIIRQGKVGEYGKNISTRTSSHSPRTFGCLLRGQNGPCLGCTQVGCSLGGVMGKGSNVMNGFPLVGTDAARDADALANE